MSSLNDLFASQEYDHPKLRLWVAKLEAGASAVIEVRRPWDGIMRLRPEIFIEFLSTTGEVIDVDSASWEPGLNSTLINKGVRARSLPGEAERFSIVFRQFVEPLTRRYGDDYLNSVLIEYLSDMNLMAKAEIQDLMPSITSYSPHQSEHRDECRGDIHAILARMAQECTKRLHYSQPETLDIITAAIAEYLDERFSVTSRRKLGWAKPSKGFWSLVAELAPKLPGAQYGVKWTASSAAIATYLQSGNFNVTAVTVERELLDHSASDPSFPWSVTLDSTSQKLVFTPKPKWLSH